MYSKIFHYESSISFKYFSFGKWLRSSLLDQQTKILPKKSHGGGRFFELWKISIHFFFGANRKMDCLCSDCFGTFILLEPFKTKERKRQGGSNWSAKSKITKRRSFASFLWLLIWKEKKWDKPNNGIMKIPCTHLAIFLVKWEHSHFTEVVASSLLQKDFSDHRKGVSFFPDFHFQIRINKFNLPNPIFHFKMLNWINFFISFSYFINIF